MFRTILIVAASLMLCLAGCGSDDPSGANGDPKNGNPSGTGHYGGCMIEDEEQCIEYPLSEFYRLACQDEGNTWHANGCPKGYKAICTLGQNTVYGMRWYFYDGADLEGAHIGCLGVQGTWSEN